MAFLDNDVSQCLRIKGSMGHDWVLICRRRRLCKYAHFHMISIALLPVRITRTDHSTVRYPVLLRGLGRVHHAQRHHSSIQLSRKHPTSKVWLE
jgi:hypothetical protein